VELNEAVDDLRTIQDLVRWGVSEFRRAEIFFGHGTDNAIDEALALVVHGLALPHGLPAELLATRTTRSERQRVVDLFARRVNERIPAAYLIGEAWFAGLPFYVDSRVIVPRSPIAELIEKQFAPWTDGEQVEHVLDLCTGSGCIAIACALAFPAAHVDAVELSAGAFEVAQRNVARHHVEEHVTLLQGDLFAPIPNGRRYDVIVSNPPYVGREEMALLPAEYGHEPAMALAAGEDGLSVVTRILREARHYLQPDGILVVEVGNAEVALVERFSKVPFTWLEFSRGGGGVFLLTAAELEQHVKEFRD